LTVRYDRSLSTQFCRNIPLSPLPRYSISDTLLYVHKLNFIIEAYFWWFLLAFHSILVVKPIILWGDYPLCCCTYLRRLCSVLLHVSGKIIFSVTARISKHMYDKLTIQTSLIQVNKIHFMITYISYKCLILAYIINNHNLNKIRSTPLSFWQEPLEVKYRWTFFYDYILKRSTNQKALPGFVIA
jgi:hypothetical protein